LAACALAEVRALKMVLLPTLGKPTIPQFSGTVTFLYFIETWRARNRDRLGEALRMFRKPMFHATLRIEGW
jgi:hypothetical protein